MLSISTFGLPNWIEQGPGPITVNAGFEQVAAVEALAAHPTDPNILYAATINGGVWKTTNATAANPTWTPLTDQLPSLSMSAIAFSPFDANTLYAGTGLRSAGGNVGKLGGMMRTTDGGSTWTVIGQDLAA